MVAQLWRGVAAAAGMYVSSGRENEKAKKKESNPGQVILFKVGLFIMVLTSGSLVSVQLWADTHSDEVER